MKISTENIAKSMHYQNEHQFSISAIGETERLRSETSDGVARDEILISSENPVRGMRVLSTGIDYADYRNNPVVGYNHAMGTGAFGIGESLMIPLARTVSLTPIPGRGMKAEFEWPPWGQIDEIDKYHKLWDLRFLHAASIWFHPDVVEERKNAAGDVVEEIATKSTLREWSIVYMPADPGAVREARSIFRTLISPEMMRRDFQKVKRLRNFAGDVSPRPKVRTDDFFRKPMRDSSQVEEVQRAEQKTVVPVEIDFAALTNLEQNLNKLLESFNG